MTRIVRPTVLVRYPETDRMGVAWHGHYLAWFEIGRTEWMREAGIPYGRLEDQRGIRFPVVAADARFLAPARYDERLNVETRLVEVSGVRVRFAYRVEGVDDGRLRATGTTMHAAVDAGGRPRRLPPDLRSRLLEDSDDAT